MPRSDTHTQTDGSARRLAGPVVAGAVLLAALVAITPYNDYFVQGSYMASHHVPVAATFVLFLLCLAVNPLLRRLGRRGAVGISTRGLCLIWAMLAISSGIPSSGLMRFLIPVLPALGHYASPENKWGNLLQPYIPDWLVPTDEEAIRRFYDGAPPGAGIPWGAWVGPIIAWSILALLVYWVLLCLAVLIRRQWIDRERMTFPHVQLPMALIEAPESGRRWNSFLRDRLMWTGFGLIFVLYGITGLSSYIPAVPKVTILYPNYWQHAIRFRSAPWSAADYILPGILPSIVGFGFLLPTEVSLSVWVFYFLFKLQAVAFSALGVQLTSVASGYSAQQFTAYQDMGAYLALIAVILYVSREHLRQAWRAATGVGSGSTEARPYAIAIFGGAIGLLLLIGVASYAGISWPVALEFFVGYFVVCIAVSWITSSTGLLFMPVSFRPQDYLYSCIGTRSLAARDIAVLALPSRVFTFYYREMLMPHYLNNFRLAQETWTPRRTLTVSMGVAVALGLAVAWWAHLQLAYSKGAYSLQPLSYLSWSRTPFSVAAQFISQPQSPDPMSYVFIGVGAVIFLGLSALRARFLWWPLHPAGALLGSVSHEQWFSLFAAWLCKATILRYGGPGAYRRARTFFLGLIVGEAAIGCVWIIIGFVTGTGVRLLP
jgi:hypothetical protein